jgi:chromosome segregation ATPase
MAFLKDNEREQLRQLVKACLLEISKLKIELKKCQEECSTSKKQDTKAIEKYKEQQQGEIREKELEIKKLLDSLDEKDGEIADLRRMKKLFQAATSKPKRDLTSFQTQIYLLLPEDEDTMKNLYNYIREIGYQELTSDNFEYALRNLERKGYFKSSQQHNIVVWKKIEKD